MYMINCVRTLRQCHERCIQLEEDIKLYIMNGELVTKETVKSYKKRFTSIFYDSILSCNENHHLLRRNKYKQALNEIIELTNNVAAADELDSLKICIENIKSIIYPLIDKEYSFNDMNYTAQRYFDEGSQCYTFVQNDLPKIFELIKMPKNRMANMFVPNCYDGKNLDIVLPEYYIYGNEYSLEEYKEAKERFFKVIRGGTAVCKIKNNAFDVLYLQPPIPLTEDDMLKTKGRRSENYYITTMFRYLRDGGIAIIVMPYTRFYIDNCRMLSRYMKDIQVFKNAASADFISMGLVYIIGRKKKDKDIDYDEYNYLRRCCNSDYIKNINDISTNTNISYYNISSNIITIDMFRSEILDEEEIENIFNNSSLNTKIIQDQCISSKATKRKPLLPFNLGQLGLILTSGCLDGVVKEENGTSHIVKGRVEKRILKNEGEDDKGNKTEKLTYINKVEINVLLPNGEFKTIT